MWRYQNQTRHGKRCYSAFSNYSADQIRKVKSVPDFRLLHWKLQDQLDKNSAKFKPITTTTPFKFEKNLPQHYCWVNCFYNLQYYKLNFDKLIVKKHVLKFFFLIV